MYKLAAGALSAALGVTGVVQSTTAEAHPTLTVSIGLPGVAVVAGRRLSYSPLGGVNRKRFGRHPLRQY